jgi:hypothetical protein
MNTATLRAAMRVRQALEALRDGSPAIGLCEFPRGACSDASEVLARYLVEERIVTLNALRVRRGRRGGVGHAWLEVSGRILDITADQFGERWPPVWAPPDSAWHDAFTGGSSEEPDIFFQARPQYAEDMTAAYLRLRESLAFGV